jgi:ribosome-associated toxin RatA of RatAB toxin-antitoxin module
MRTAFIVGLIGTCCGATPPHTWPGHTVYGDDNSRITLDVYGDYQCPDTAAAFPTLVNELPKLVNESTLRIRYHLFEILHHENAYDAAVAGYVTTQIMADHGAHVFTDVSLNLFANQTKFYNGVTVDKTRNEVRDILFEIAGAPYEILQSTWNTAYASDDAEVAVSTEHSYTIRKGITGTPTFWVQDQAAPEPTNVDVQWTAQQWADYINKI